MSQRPGAGPQGTRPANSGPQAAQSNPAPRRRGPAPPQFVLQMEPDGPSASPKNARDVNPDDPLHEAVTSSIMVALALMRSDKGKYRLPTTGEDVFKYKLPQVVEKSLSGCIPTNPFQNKAIESMARAKQGTSTHHIKTYDTFAFVHGLEIARGMVLCFAGSLMPFSRDIPTSRGRELDEAWEDRMFFGEIHNVRDTKDEFEIYQAGSVWTEFKLPLVTRGESIPLNNFWSTQDAMSDMRAWLRDWIRKGNNVKLFEFRQQQAPGPARTTAATSASTTPSKPAVQKAQATTTTKTTATTKATARTTATATATAAATTNTNSNATAQRRNAANTTGNGTGNGAGRGAGRGNGNGNGTGNGTR
ncbi:predicted protein [Chaetomium globosum CBS 148.51]|uniref:Uncharacterized protein n=1 Tax=Chaetomium globosum (strain ATCC 6205 / CBS 148.51 / DSM 1962 / NBRC 6347 / NRRL 1970) TaxID=306901 RepID=Q2HFQ9_CHAGB|nr:uncharacterized protein CHGG_00945 [Chaetomium globosum CBS 148.51]EAQ92710.1 predicted protein [Chaetomium globosum CBS 148.51]